MKINPRWCGGWTTTALTVFEWVTRSSLGSQGNGMCRWALMNGLVEQLGGKAGCRR